MSLSREELLYLATASEQAERYENLVDYMKQLIAQINKGENSSEELSEVERKIFSTGCKKKLEPIRYAWLDLDAVEQKEENRGGRHIAALKEYRTTLKHKVEVFCREIVGYINSSVLPICQSVECKAFFLKMRADFYRYLAECSLGEHQDKAYEDCIRAYDEAVKVAIEGLKVDHYVRMGVILNFGIFYAELRGEVKKGLEICKGVFDDVTNVDKENCEGERKDSTLVLELIQNKITEWRALLPEEEQII